VGTRCSGTYLNSIDCDHDLGGHDIRCPAWVSVFESSVNVVTCSRSKETVHQWKTLINGGCCCLWCGLGCFLCVHPWTW
jgi:hypothetical protein